jgi:ubiquinone/menaquinone biosynthesis C-methylase UbiE
MYNKSARYYDAIYSFKDYASASQQLHDLISRHHPGAETLLDVGCGTGRHLEYLKAHYQVAGLDISSEMLDVARRRCPDVPFYQKDMIDFNLRQSFDVVTCLFSAIGSVKTVENLERALFSMASHLSSRGLLIVEPWFSPESYWTGKVYANYVDQPDLKIAWMYTSQIEGRLSVHDINYLVGTPEGIEHFTERREVGLFTREEYLSAFRESGLEAYHDPQGLFGRGLYIGLKTVPDR